MLYNVGNSCHDYPVGSKLYWVTDPFEILSRAVAFLSGKFTYAQNTKDFWSQEYKPIFFILLSYPFVGYEIDF